MFSYAWNLDILDANASQLRELRRAIGPLARKLAARMRNRAGSAAVADSTCAVPSVAP